MTDTIEAGSGPAASIRQPGEGGPGLGRSGRMSRQRKRDAVLRLGSCAARTWSWSRARWA
jgi:hypothetical protein